MDRIKLKQYLLLALLLILSVLYRIQYKYPHHPDHYTLGQYTQVILEKGYATWVLHPTSLFGYYPLSVPSGLEFFFSFLSVITGLDLGTLFYYFSIFSGIFTGIGVFLLMRRWTSFLTSYLCAFALMTMTFFALDTSNTASSRIFNIMLYPLFIILLFMMYEKGSRIKLFAAATLLFITMSLIHRLSQLSLIFVVAIVCASIAAHWKKLFAAYQKTPFYRIRENHYKESKLYVLVDLLLIFLMLFAVKFLKENLVLAGWLILAIGFYFLMDFKRIRTKSWLFFDINFYVFSIVAAKAIDLSLRGRLEHHLEKVLQLVSPKLLVMIGGGGVILGLLILWLLRQPILRLVHWLMDKTEKLAGWLFSYIEHNPEGAVTYSLLIVLVMFIIAVFFSGGLFDIDTKPYESSFLLKGDAPWVLLFNFLMNLNNNLTMLIWFVFFGFIYLFRSKHKTVYHYFFILVAIGFSQFIFDWEYVRLYMNPIYAIFIGLGMSYFLSKTFNSKKFLTFLMILFITLHFAVSNIFLHRQQVFGILGLDEGYPQLDERYYIGAGDYLDMPGENALISTHSLTRPSILAFYSGKPEAAATQSIFINRNMMNVTPFTISDIINSGFKGEKLRELYTLNDWIFGGEYYFGRHVNYFANQYPGDRTATRIAEENNIKYVVDSVLPVPKANFFRDVPQLNNKIYDSPTIGIWDFERGWEYK